MIIEWAATPGKVKSKASRPSPNQVLTHAARAKGSGQSKSRPTRARAARATGLCNVGLILTSVFLVRL